MTDVKKSFSLRFLRWFCPPDLYEGIEGDLLEQFETDLESVGPKRAGWRLKWNVLRFLRPGIVMRNTFQNRLTNTGILRNYMTIASRNIIRYPGHTTMNVLGLALGLASCFLIGLYVRYELSFDNFHVKGEHIYRYIPQFAKDGEMTLQVQTAAGIAPHLQATVPEVEQAVRYTEWEEQPFLKWKEKELPAATLSLADSNFFHMFSFRLQEGNSADMLTRPMTVVISKTIAKTIFGGESPIGQLITYDNNLELEVMGVFEDVPANSHLQFSYLVSVASLPKLYGADQTVLSSMDNWNFSTYLYAPSIVDLPGFDQRVTEAMVTKMKALGTFGDGEAAAAHWLQPLTDIHFTQGIRGDGPTSNISRVYIFSAVAIFIILIACFNFMNLSTTRAIGRAKEVGIRKVMGAVRRQLVVQFLSEAFIIVFVAGVLSLLLFWLAVPWFNEALGLRLTFEIGNDWQFVAQLLGIIVATAFVAGSYPAFYLSSFTPSATLRGGNPKGGKAGFRNILTVIQFSISVFLLIGTLVISSQLSYMKEAKMGYEKDLVVHFQLTDDLEGEKFESFRNALLNHHGIAAVSRGSDVPGNITGHNIFEVQVGEEKRIKAFTYITADYGYLDALGIEVVEGRQFSREFPTDETQGYLVNETLVKFLGLDKQPGRVAGTPMRWLYSSSQKGNIIGVVKDFHARSLQNKIEPMAIWFSEGGSVGVLKLNGNDVSGALAALEEEWGRSASGYPLNYTFLDESLGRMYLAEEKSMTLAGAFSILAIFISCMGLIGLVSYVAEQRKKEIGIRKVLGASMVGIVTLFSWRFIRLVVVAAAVTVPLSVLAVDEWLANFAYAAQLQLWVYGIPILIVLLITVAVAAGFTIKASKANPVDCLRNE
ncbi:MAG: FtsX-like permease family protein [Imperialibacter sp.]